MVQGSDDYLIAWAPVARQRPSQCQIEGRHVLSEYDLAGVCIQHVCHCGASVGHDDVGLATRHERTTEIRTARRQESNHRIDHPLGHLGATGTVGIDGVTITKPSRQCGKLLPG